jgi:hypothetical protein
MKQLFLFGWTVLLFIICTPGVIFEPNNYKLIGMILHSLIFTILYSVLYNHMTNVIEGLTQESREEISNKFEETKTKLFQELKNIEDEQLSTEEQIKKTQKLFDEYFKEWSKEDIDLFEKKYATFFKENFKIGDNENMEYLLNNASPEKIQIIDSLSEKQQEALEKIYLSMDHDSIDKVLKLDNEVFKQVLNEIIEKQ